MARKKRGSGVSVQKSRRNRSLSKPPPRNQKRSKLPRCRDKPSTVFNTEPNRDKSKPKGVPKHDRTSTSLHWSSSEKEESCCTENQIRQEVDHHDFLGSLDLKPVYREADVSVNFTEVDICLSKDKEDQLVSGNDCLKEYKVASNLHEGLTVMGSSTRHNCDTASCDGTEKLPLSPPSSKESILERLNFMYNSKGSAFGVGDDCQTFYHEVVEDRIIQRVQQIEKSYKHEVTSSRYQEDAVSAKDTTLITFRDNNKKLKINSDGTAHDENMPNFLFDTLDIKRKGQKRRYAKLMKRLEDTEKSLETNLKGIMELEKEDKTDKINVSACIDKVKKKLCVRAKKKYESLINYQRIKVNVEQKSFEDLLPEKADIVKSNIVKEIAGGKIEKVHRVSKPRGRPRKLPGSLNVTKRAKDKNSGHSYKTQVNDASSVKEFPRNSPRSLLQDSNAANIMKADKIRLGIIDKNGAKEVIELSNETLKTSNLNKRDTKQCEESSEDQTMERSANWKHGHVDGNGDKTKG